MKSKRRIHVPLALLLSGVVALGVFSCRNRSEVRQTLEAPEMTGFENMENIKEVYYRFPSPDEMLNFIDREKLSFNDELLLPIENARSFLDSKSQALNLGVYTADLAYITLFQRQKEALVYFQVVYGLCDKLRIISAFDPGLLNRFEQNLDSPDSLKALSDEAFGNISDYLVREDKEKIFAIISIGAFVESLHLAFGLVDDFSADNAIVQRISDQKYVLENLLNYALEYSGDKNVQDAVELIHSIRAVFNELRLQEEETQVTKNEDGSLFIGGGTRVSITKEQFAKLKSVTNETRLRITETLEN